VPASPSDRRLLLVTGAFVVLAGLLVAGLLFLATGGGQATPKPGPLYIGLESDLRSMIHVGGPLYFAHPFGGTGFWLTVEHGNLVALVARRPGIQSCTVKWESHRDAYIDCHGEALTSEDLGRYPVELPRGGVEAGGVIVDFRRVDPAPQPAPTSG
jgi:hypothetical protein